MPMNVERARAVMEREGLDPLAAFASLRQRARRERRRAAEVAQEILEAPPGGGRPL